MHGKCIWKYCSMEFGIFIQKHCYRKRIFRYSIWIIFNYFQILYVFLDQCLEFWRSLDQLVEVWVCLLDFHFMVHWIFWNTSYSNWNIFSTNNQKYLPLICVGIPWFLWRENFEYVWTTEYWRLWKPPTSHEKTTEK